MTLVKKLRAYAQTSYDEPMFGSRAVMMDAAAEIERLQATLKKYGRHSLDDRCCAVYKCRGLTCDCGWGDALKTLEEQAT